jgi:hypothetical protein
MLLEKLSASPTKTYKLVLCGDIIPIYSESNMNPRYAFVRSRELLMSKQVVHILKIVI